MDEPEEDELEEPLSPELPLEELLLSEELDADGVGEDGTEPLRESVR